MLTAKPLLPKRRRSRDCFLGLKARSPRKSSFQVRKGSIGSLLTRIHCLRLLLAAGHWDSDAWFEVAGGFLGPIDHSRRVRSLHGCEQRGDSFVRVAASHRLSFARRSNSYRAIR